MGCFSSKSQHSLLPEPKFSPFHVVKCVLIGPVKSNKTKFVNSAQHVMKNTKFEHADYNETFAVNYDFFTLQKPEETVKFQLWDTSGDQRFSAIIRSYFREGIISFLFYKQNELDQLSTYINHMPELNDRKRYIVLISDQPNRKFEELTTPSVISSSSIPVSKHYVLDFTNGPSVLEVFENLHTFLEEKKDEWTHFYNSKNRVVVKKPAIYVYGPDQTTVSVKINTKYPITKEIPARVENKWVCRLNDDKLTINDEPSEYIYWEATDLNNELQEKLIPACQFTMMRNNYKSLSVKLSSVLNSQELKDFDEYWEPIFMEKPDEAIRVTLITESSFSNEFPLEVDRHVNLVRVEFLFEETDEATTNWGYIDFKSFYPQLDHLRLNADKEIGLVEWGGIIIN